jgi:hypothetical protein
MATEKKEREPEVLVFRRNIRFLASKVVYTKDFESDDYRVRLPREGAALESMSYADAEALLIKANDNYTQLQVYLAQAQSARAFFKRTADMKEKLVAGDPELLKEAGRSASAREYQVAKNPEFNELMQDLRTCEVVVAYLERLSAASLETLQVVKKVRDAALSRREKQGG